MKRNSIIEMPEKYSSPFVIVVAFKPEGPLCQSTEFGADGSGNSGYRPGDDGWGNDEWD